MLYQGHSIQVNIRSLYSLASLAPNISDKFRRPDVFPAFDEEHSYTVKGGGTQQEGIVKPAVEHYERDINAVLTKN